MANEIVMTQEGYNDLVKELNELKTTRRAEISEKIRVARGFGDLSENSEYDEAKNEQAIVEARILTLENQLKNVKIVAKSDNKGTVSIGSFVTWNLAMKCPTVSSARLNRATICPPSLMSPLSAKHCLVIKQAIRLW